MFEEEIMTTEELNQSYVAINSRAKGPPSITVKVSHRDARFASEEATGIFNYLTTYYDTWWEERNPKPIESEPKEGGEDA